MGWGTTFNAGIYLNRKTFNSISELNEEIDNLYDEISSIRESILIQAAGGIAAFSKSEYISDDVSNFKSSMNEYFDQLAEANDLLYKLLLFKEMLDETGDDIGKYNPFKNNE